MSDFDYLFKLNDVITLENYQEYMKPDHIIFLVLAWPTAIAITGGQVLNVEEFAATIDAPAIIHCKVLIHQVNKNYGFTLDEFNGHSDMVGSEMPPDNQNRIFFSQEKAIEYAEMIKFQREVQVETTMGFFGKFLPPDDFGQDFDES